ncbi:MAG: STAS domain-containing protein [Lachnospiraceae bacterium]|nr:STAS domain-containing protein [Lachnospiraceae bacterium]
MTVDPDYNGKETIEGAKKVENLSITYNVEKGILNCKTDGRIDTISAPALLEVLDSNSEGVNAVRIDADNLEYISSAGLRVLLMAMKKHGGGSVSVYGASDPVKEIFETTGFDQMIRIE